MIQKNIFEMRDSEYNKQREFRIIIDLFFKPIFILDNSNPYDIVNNKLLATIEKVIDTHCFYSWKQRGHCLDTSDFKEKIGLHKLLDEINIITSLEYICNMIYLADMKLPASVELYRDKYELLKGNIDILLEHLNYEKHVFEKEEKVLLIPKNPMATSVAEISSEDTANAIFQYHHESLKGDLEAKRDILRRIAKEYETILNNPDPSILKSYCRDAKWALNNLDIRHNNMEKVFMRNLSHEELEKLYDALYELLLFCIQGQKKEMRIISEFKKKIES